MAASKLSLNHKHGFNRVSGMKDRLPQAVIFDMDGVLCNTDSLHYQSWEEAIRGYNIPFDQEINHKLRGLNRVASLQVLLAGLEMPLKDQQHILEVKNQVYVASLSTLGPANLLPGVPQFLNELIIAGIEIGVASASQHVERVLKQLGIALDVHAFSDGMKVTRSKPAPDAYKYVARHLDVDPIECVAIEDSQAGIQSARSAGMCVIGLGGPETLTGVDFLYPSMEQVDLHILQTIYSTYLSYGEPGE